MIDNLLKPNKAYEREHRYRAIFAKKKVLAPFQVDRYRPKPVDEFQQAFGR